MSLPLLHAGRTNPGLSAALDLKFASTLSLTSSSGITPSFSRASSGTYFGADGLLKYAGLNNAQYSQELDNAYWGKLGSSVTPNATTAPDGSLTADKIVEASGGTYHNINYTTYSTSGSFTASVYLKAGERSFASIEIIDNFRAVINLSTGAIVSNTLGGSTITATDAGNGWWRVAYTVTNITRIIIYTLNSSTFGPYSGDGSSGIYAWGIQLESGTTATTYGKTLGASNSAPRFDHTYNGSAWVSRGLLIEEQRTNLCYYSEDFSNGYWTKENGTIVSNFATAPDGNTSASKLYADSSGQYRSFKRYLNTGKTVSVFAKASGKSFFAFLAADYLSGSVVGAAYDLSTGTVGSVKANHTATITNVGNGWFRCTLTYTAGSFIYLQMWLQDSLTSNGSVTASGTDGVLFWGAQCEDNLFATSYIPTTSASTTRSADVCQITGTDFSSFWNATEGSVAIEFDRIGNKPSADQETFNFSNAGGTEQIYHNAYAGSDYVLYYSGSATQANLSAGSTSAINTVNKIATAYKVNDFALSTNGAAVVTDTSGTVPTPDRVYVGSGIGSLYLCGHIARLRYYRKRLPNATLQLLSEPDPTLNLQFALNKTLTPVAGPAPSFSRASTGTYFNASGVLTSASINTPRFDHVYSGGQWVSRGLLIEEQRTNGFLRSNEFSNAATWFTTNNLVSTDSTTSPDGTIAFKVTPTTSSNAEKNIFQLATIANSLNTHSIYVKSGTQNFIQLMFTGGDTNYANFNISSGVTGNKSAGVSSSTISGVGNGWYRISVTLTNSGASGFAIFWINSLTDSRAPSTTSAGSIYLFGAQYEIGAFPTSYIPTTSSSVTRSADVCQITGTGFSGIYNQSEGSFAVEYDSLIPPVTGKVGSVYAAENAAGSNALIPYIYNSALYIISKYGGANNFNRNLGAATNAAAKLANCYKANDFAASLNGAAVLTDTGTVGSDFSKLFVGTDSSGSQYLNGHISRLRYYAIRLPDRLLIAKSQ